MSRALITGIAGQDGHYLTRLLLDKGYDVFGVVRPGHGPPDRSVDDRAVLLTGDMRDAPSLLAAIELSQPDEIYNFAAVSSLAEADADPELCIDVNAGGAERLVAAIDELGLRSSVRLCQASSGLIFGPPDGTVRDESTPLAPIGAYATAKARAHQLMGAARERGLFAVSAILFNHESPLRSLRFVSRRVSRGVADIKLGRADRLVLGNLDAVRDWGFAGDYVAAMWTALQAPVPDDYVIATGESHTVRELVGSAFSAAGISEWHSLVDAETEVGPKETWSPANPERARRELGWFPRVSFDELVAMMVSHDLDGG